LSETDTTDHSEQTGNDTRSENTATEETGDTRASRGRRGRRGGRGRGSGSSDRGGGAATDAVGAGDGGPGTGDRPTAGPAPDAADESTSRDSSAGAADERSAGSEAGSDDGSEAGSEVGSDDDRGARRRRRRGRRGRGRGKSQGENVATADEAAAAPPPNRPSEAKDQAASEDEPGTAQTVQTAPKDGNGKRDTTNGSDRKGSDRGGDRTRAKSGDEPKAKAAKETGDGDGVEAEIARGGTRMAAKRGNRRNSGNGGGGNRRGQQRPGGVPEEVRRAILEGPPRTMLVTAREDRTQIAVMEDRSVVEHYVTRKDEVTFVGNIYMARVQNVLPGMEAAFLDIGKGRNGVLYAGEVLFDELDLEEGADQRIENVLKPGQKVLVQVTKDPMGTKGPRLTMHLSLAGRYVVLAPDSDLFGISRKLTDKERDRLRRIVKQVKPEHHGVIVRTAAEGATEDQIIADMERLLAKWTKVEKAAEGAKALTAVYEEPSLVVKVIRDNFGPEFERCIVDDEDLYHQVRGYLDEVAEELLPKVELYGAPTRDARARAAGAPAAEGADAITHQLATGAAPTGEGSEDAVEGAEATDVPSPDEPATADADADAGADAAETPEPAVTQEPPPGSPDPTQPAGVGTVDLAAAATRRESLPPLFEAYDVADQLRKAMGRKIWLPSGGYLIIETTEAMKVIDVNTGKFTGGKDTNLEEVVLKTNLEAADEIVRQLRLRDMGGIIIIDFIDMLLKANQDQVVRRLKRELLRDRTKTRVSEVSRLGLVQMTRKNVSQGLIESFSHTCQACEGRGIIGELD
jgi:Ribonuclease G/E